MKYTELFRWLHSDCGAAASLSAFRFRYSNIHIRDFKIGNNCVRWERVQPFVAMGIVTGHVVFSKSITCQPQRWTATRLHACTLRHRCWRVARSGSHADFPGDRALLLILKRIDFLCAMASIICAEFQSHEWHSWTKIKGKIHNENGLIENLQQIASIGSKVFANRPHSDTTRLRRIFGASLCYGESIC